MAPRAAAGYANARNKATDIQSPSRRRVIKPPERVWTTDGAHTAHASMLRRVHMRIARGPSQSGSVRSRVGETRRQNKVLSHCPSGCMPTDATGTRHKLHADSPEAICHARRVSSESQVSSGSQL